MTAKPLTFAIAVSDGYRSVLEAFLAAGGTLAKLFVPPGDHLNDTKEVVARALELGAKIQVSPATQADLEALGQEGCEALVVASYPWRIPAWEQHLRYAVNFHPSPLPEGRGPYPLVQAILEDRRQWSVSCHRIAEVFDGGNILDAESFALDADECHESLFLKVQMAAGRLAARVANDLEGLWSTAKVQGEGSYWPRWSEQDRVIDFSQPVEAIMRRIRAFGDLECMATLNGIHLYIHRAKGWRQDHAAVPGSVVHASNMAMVVAASDGLIAITEWSLIAAGAPTARLR